MIIVKNIIKNFNESKVKVLRGLSFIIKRGEFVSISGKSGSGKSTLLYIISSLDLPSTGDVIIDSMSTKVMKEDEMNLFRNQKIGFIFQSHYLLPELTAIENVLLAPRKLNKHEEYTERGIQLLNEMGVSNTTNKLPSQMSGGEQQRVAIARALIMKPDYIFADEPTGNLDSYSGEVVMNILKRINKEHNTTICMVTHDKDFAAMADREIFLVDGKIKSYS